MGEWEITAGDGKVYRESGRAAVNALLASGKVSGTDELFDKQNGSRLTVMEYLDRVAHEEAAARAAGPVAPPVAPPAINPPPVPKSDTVSVAADDGIPRSWWLGGIAALILVPLIGYGVFSLVIKTDEPAAPASSAGEATGVDASPATRPTRPAREPRSSGGDQDNETRTRPSPVAVGETHEVTIESVGSRGDGMARIEGLVVFIPGTKEGETVKVRITKIGPRSAQAEVVR